MKTILYQPIATNINIDKDNSIVYQTKNKYNEQTINFYKHLWFQSYR